MMIMRLMLKGSPTAGRRSNLEGSDVGAENPSPEGNGNTFCRGNWQQFCADICPRYV